MMPKLRFKWRDALFLSLGAICATVANNWSFFVFDKSIGIADLFTAVIGGYIGLYVGSKLNSKVSSDRVEKDILIAEITSVRGIVARFNSLIEANNLLLTEAISLFRNASQGLSLAKEMIQICNDNSDLVSKFTTVLGSVRNINSKITGISPVNGRLIIPQSDTTQIMVSFRELNKELFHLIILVNRDSN